MFCSICQATRPQKQRAMAMRKDIVEVRLYNDEILIRGCCVGKAGFRTQIEKLRDILRQEVIK